MTVDRETVLRAKEMLRSDDGSELQTLRDDRLLPLFGGDSWLDPDDDQLEAGLNSWLTDEESSSLAAAVEASAAGEDGALHVWFQSLVARWDQAAEGQAEHFQDQTYPTELPQAEANPATEHAVRYQGVSAVEGYPGWWQGWDTSSETPDGWRYVYSGTTPDDSTERWTDQATAFAAMAQAVAQRPYGESAQEGAAADTEQVREASAPMAEDVITGIVEDVAPVVAEVLDGIDVSRFSEEQIQEALAAALMQVSDESRAGVAQ